jgi:putative endonuclease
MAFYVYILASGRNGTLYIGSTDDLARRIEEHRGGALSGFTKKYGVTILVWFEAYETRETALIRERAMKKWNRAWKMALIEKTNSGWNDLSGEIPF